jgi:hypothetical protein
MMSERNGTYLSSAPYGIDGAQPYSRGAWVLVCVSMMSTRRAGGERPEGAHGGGEGSQEGRVDAGANENPSPPANTLEYPK